MSIRWGDQGTFNEAAVSVLSHLTDAIERMAQDRGFPVPTGIKAARTSLAIMDRLLVDPEAEPDAAACPPPNTEPGSGMAPNSPHLDPKTGPTNI